MGMSAAGALSLSLALNEILGCGFSRERCVKTAHDAEVECGTGLSGADAAAMGGLLAQRRIGKKPVSIPLDARQLHFAFYSPIRTASIISKMGWKSRVNAAGERALAELFKEKSWGGFVCASRSFALRSGLAGWCRKEMLANPRASMAMLGKTLFSDEKMRLARKPGLLLKAKAYEKGAAIL
jgi:pantoate kinase